MTRRRRRTLVVLAVLAAVVAVAFVPARRHLRAAGLLLRFERAGDAAPAWLVGFGEHEVSVRQGQLETTEGTLRVRRYVPRDAPEAPAVVLVHGVHPDGIDEPRLRHFARVMASAGLRVLTPEIAGLTRYAIEPPAIDAIGAAAEAHARETGRDAAGVVGISFSGGLALLAAADARWKPSVAFVLAVGAHHDMARVVRWYAGEPIEDPEGRPPPVEPHPYGAGVFIYTQLERFFSEPDRPRARRALELALEGRWKQARARIPTLSEPGREQLRRILRHEDVAPLRAEVLRAVEARAAELARVSPAGHLDGLEAPVFLVHGTGDPVVPATETRWLAREVPEAALERAVVTPVLRHAEKTAEPGWGRRWELVRFMAEVLDAAG